jgi:hypothetical protein
LAAALARAEAAEAIAAAAAAAQAGVDAALARIDARAASADERSRLASDKVRGLLNRPAAAPPAAEPAAPSRPVVGPAGEVDVDGAPFRVDAALAGQPYEVVSVGRGRRVRVDGRFVNRSPA